MSSDGTRPRVDTLRILDLAQSRMATVIAGLRDGDWARPTPCPEWTVRDIVNKVVASTWSFTEFAHRRRPVPPWDLVHPVEVIGEDPLGVYLAAAAASRDAWRTPGALEGTAPSTQGEFPAKAVINARIFDTSILQWDVAVATGQPPLIDDEQAAYVLRVARSLVSLVRGKDPARFGPPGPAAGRPLLDQMIAASGRDPDWTPPCGAGHAPLGAGTHPTGGAGSLG